MTNRANRSDKVFVLGQPLFQLVEDDPDARWQAATSEAEPRDEPRRKVGFTPAFRPPGAEEGAEREPAWERLERGALVKGLAERKDQWLRVAVVCGAGLGKTTNLQWLEAAVNRRGRQLAFFLEMKDLISSAADLFDVLFGRIKTGLPGVNEARLRYDLERRFRQGRITLFLDSLDQAGPDPEGRAVRALRTLLSGAWSACPVWVSGRPHAFRVNRGLFQDDPRASWQFVRIGQLDEPECRFLLETVRAARLARLQGTPR